MLYLCFYRLALRKQLFNKRDLDVLYEFYSIVHLVMCQFELMIRTCRFQIWIKFQELFIYKKSIWDMPILGVIFIMASDILLHLQIRFLKTFVVIIFGSLHAIFKKSSKMYAQAHFHTIPFYVHTLTFYKYGNHLNKS